MTDHQLAREDGHESVVDVLNLFNLRPAWQTRALCRDKRDLFFPLLPGGHIPNGGHPIHDAAKNICVRCSAIEECRSYAIEMHCSDGVYGGMNPEERRRWVARERTRKHRAKVRAGSGAA